MYSKSPLLPNAMSPHNGDYDARKQEILKKELYRQELLAQMAQPRDSDLLERPKRKFNPVSTSIHERSKYSKNDQTSYSNYSGYSGYSGYSYYKSPSKLGSTSHSPLNNNTQLSYQGDYSRSEINKHSYKDNNLNHNYNGSEYHHHFDDSRRKFNTGTRYMSNDSMEKSQSKFIHRGNSKNTYHENRVRSGVIYDEDHYGNGNMNHTGTSFEESYNQNIGRSTNQFNHKNYDRSDRNYDTNFDRKEDFKEKPLNGQSQYEFRERSFESQRQYQSEYPHKTHSQSNFDSPRYNLQRDDGRILNNHRNTNIDHNYENQNQLDSPVSSSLSNSIPNIPSIEPIPPTNYSLTEIGQSDSIHPSQTFSSTQTPSQLPLPIPIQNTQASSLPVHQYQKLPIPQFPDYSQETGIALTHLNNPLPHSPPHSLPHSHYHSHLNHPSSFQSPTNTSIPSTPSTQPFPSPLHPTFSPVSQQFSSYYPPSNPPNPPNHPNPPNSAFPLDRQILNLLEAQYSNPSTFQNHQNNSYLSNPYQSTATGVIPGVNIPGSSTISNTYFSPYPMTTNSHLPGVGVGVSVVGNGPSTDSSYIGNNPSTLLNTNSVGNINGSNYNHTNTSNYLNAVTSPSSSPFPSPFPFPTPSSLSSPTPSTQHNFSSYQVSSPSLSTSSRFNSPSTVNNTLSSNSASITSLGSPKGDEKAIRTARRLEMQQQLDEQRRRKEMDKHQARLDEIAEEARIMREREILDHRYQVERDREMISEKEARETSNFRNSSTFSTPVKNNQQRFSSSPADSMMDELDFALQSLTLNQQNLTNSKNSNFNNNSNTNTPVSKRNSRMNSPSPIELKQYDSDSKYDEPPPPGLSTGARSKWLRKQAERMKMREGN